jgi:hypothetical protein
VLVGNSVIKEGQPVSEQHGLYVDWNGIPTAGGRKRKKGGKTGDAKEAIAEMNSKTVIEMSSPRKEEQKTEMTLATTDKCWQGKCHSVDKGRRGGVWRP